MSIIRKYKAWENTEVTISMSDVSETDLGDIMLACEKALDQKFNKLGNVTKTMKVYTDGVALLINDAYDSCPDFMEITQAFGFSVVEVKSNIRGKCYVLSDPLTETLRIMNPDYTLNGDFIRADADITAIIQAHTPAIKTNKSIQDIIRKLTNGESITVSAQQEVTTTKDEWAGHPTKILDVERGKIVSEERVKITGETKAFFSNAQDNLNNVNTQLQNGTVSILNSRAKKLGYTIQQRQRGNNIELVYERVT